MSSLLDSPLNIDFGNAYAVDLVEQLVSGNGSRPPDICILGLAPAARLLSKRRRLGYRPFMLMPSMSQRLMKPVSKSSPRTPNTEVDNCKYLLIADRVSNGTFCLDDLLRRRLIRRNAISLESAESDEAFVALREGAQDTRAILFFPYYCVNGLLKTSEIVPAPAENSYHIRTIMFLREEIAANKELAFALEVLLRHSWLKLMMHPKLVRQTAETLSEDTSYLESISRYGGLFRCESHSSSASFDAQDMGSVFP